ncbi:MAG: Rieske 2Fe-2S domain-containing protein, partial [bacterium]|nr:Rieske 2Fe-2S domain-containing protein [bacterium]
MTMADDAPKPAKSSPAAKFGEGFVMDAWYVAALSPDLKPGKMAPREYLGEPVLLGRTKAGQAYAIRDVCPHRAAALSAGRVKTEANG